MINLYILYISDIAGVVNDFVVAANFSIDTNSTSSVDPDSVEPDSEVLGQEPELKQLAGTRWKGIAK